jgi:hypothetical protein
MIVFYFSHYLNKRSDMGKISLNKKCDLWFSKRLLSEMFLILRRTQWDIINLHRFSVEVLVILVTFWSNLIFSTYFKSSHIRIFTKIYPVGTNCSMRSDGRTDRQMMKLGVASLNVANYPKRGHNYKENLDFLIDMFIRMFYCRHWQDDIALLNLGKK